MNLHSTRRVRDLWFIFGDIERQTSIDGAILSGGADFVRLTPDDIAELRAAAGRSEPIPRHLMARSELPFAGAASCIDDVQELAHWVNTKIGRANTALLTASRLIEDKETLYRLLAVLQDDPPMRRPARNLNDLATVLAQIGQPLDQVIIKPAVGTESRGVYRPGREETPQAVVEHLATLPDFDPGEALIVMPFISCDGGPSEYCLDGVVVDGQVEFCAVHEKTRIYEAYPIHDRAMITPPSSAIDARTLDAILAGFADAFPLKSFVFHLEVRRNKRGEVIPIDLSFRPGGGLIYKSILNTYGIDIRLAHMYASLGMIAEMRRLARAHRPAQGFTAIAAVFAAKNTPEGLHKTLGALLGEADASGGLITYDFSDVSILSASSRSLKPNVGLAVSSAASSADCLDRLDRIVERASMAFVSEQEVSGSPELGSPAPRAEPAASERAPGALGADCETIPGLITHHARTNPDSTAIMGPGLELSYAQLDRAADQLAARLTRRGVALETPVGLHLGRSPLFIVAALAVLKAGGCYVPLDKGFPKARLRAMIEDGKIACVITDAPESAVIEDYAGPVVCFGAADLLQPAAAAPGDPPVNAGPDHLACILYTSGSSGRPKGVAVTRGAIVNLVRGQSYFPTRSAPNVLHAASTAFDAASFEIWCPLLNGGRCAVYPDEAGDGRALAAFIASTKVSIAWFNASLFNAIVEDEPGILAQLEWVIIGGEVVSPTHVRKAQERVPGLRIVNGYGPTETTTFACFHLCDGLDSAEAAVPIGRALDGVELLVLDDALRPAPPGEAGELYIGGRGLARGYLGAPALTAQAFLPHPSSPEPGARIYKTGDKVRVRPDGALDFIGRLDRQVKIRGLRIELDEVENALRALPGVLDARAGLEGGKLGQVLAAEVQLSRPRSVRTDPRDLKRALMAALPPYMVPTKISLVESLPRTATGKRMTLGAETRRDEAAPHDACVNDPATLAQLAAIWSDVLEIDPPGPQGDFFQLGGHSLSAARVLTRIKRQLGVKLKLRDLFEATRLADLAERIDQARSPAAPRAPSGATPAAPASKVEQLRARIAGLSDDEVARLLEDKAQRRAWAMEEIPAGEVNQ